MLTEQIYNKVESAWIKEHGTRPIIISGYGSTEMGGILVRVGLFDSRKARIETYVLYHYCYHSKFEYEIEKFKILIIQIGSSYGGRKFKDCR